MIGKYPRNSIRSKHDSTPAIFASCFWQKASTPISPTFTPR
jgi:hypothetical protein